jgi:hypothetical protein
MESAGRHGVGDEDILSAYAFAIGWFVGESGDRPLAMLIGPDTSGARLIEVGVVQREDYGATCVVHAMAARDETAEGRIEAMSIEDFTAGQRAELEAWAAQVADRFEAGIEATPGADLPRLMALRRLRYQRRQVENEISRLVRAARTEGDSWHRIGQALGTTAEAARQRYRSAAPN